MKTDFTIHYINCLEHTAGIVLRSNFWRFAISGYIMVCCFGLPAKGQMVDYKTEIYAQPKKLATTRHFEFLIRDRKSAELGDIAITYSPNQKLVIHEVTVIDAFGETVRKYKEKDFSESSAGSESSFYSDEFVKHLTVRYNTFPYRVRYSYTKTLNEFIHICHWFPATGATMVTSVLEITTPLDYSIHIKSSPGIQHQTTRDGKNVVHRWEARTVPVPSSPGPFTPSVYDLLPSVAVMPQYFQYVHEGNSDSWANFGEWVEKLNAGKDALSQKESAHADILVDGIETDYGKITALYKYLQENTRYINVNLEQGGMDPFPAAYVCEKRYGDCKALTIYMKALLKHVGIQSFYTLVHSGEQPKTIDASFPSQQFDHVILAIPLEGDTLFLENTSKVLPMGYMGTFTQNRYALLVDGANSRLVKIPALRVEDAREEKYINLNIQSDGSVELEANVRLRGKAFEVFTFLNNEYAKSEIGSQVADYMGMGEQELKHFEFLKPSDQPATLQLSIQGQLTNQLRVTGNDMALYLPPIQTNYLETEGINHTPIRIMYPIVRTDTLCIAMPKNSMGNVDFPDDVDVDSPFGKFSIHYTLINGTAFVYKNFQLNAGNYDGSLHAELKDYLSAFAESQKRPILIQKAPQ
jgi:hypothetical protein